MMMMIFTVLSGYCSARVYKVGDSEGWTAKDEEFHVRDSLVFEYDPNINDVTHVSGALKYELCDYSSPKVVYNTGQDIVTLTEPGLHYFITSNQAQCVLGQKLEVLVIHDPLRPIPLPTPSKFLSVGKTYKVRVSEGWKVYDNDFYNKWSEEKQFHVGDSLIFEYTNEVNDFYEINGDLEFMTCDLTSPVAVHKTRHDPVRLTEPRVHYFITSQSGYCEVDLPAMEPLNNWLQTFKPQPHH
ncbi:hypothetical protein BRARA_G01393 [Brassica rapa]|uniref:Phytocyanin domain-containing protein n=1 Tax=Brassica campestris TaxID=3711 RepID=A0A397YSM3_BRACM|nr:hypothetical protein BRARA_G01393 [Brassica rapa]